MEFTTKELDSLYMACQTLTENMTSVMLDPRFNKLGKTIAKDIVDTLTSVVTKLEKATGVKKETLSDYKRGDEKEFTINPKLN